MQGQKEQKTPAPNVDQIRAHVNFITSGMREHEDGIIEIAYGDDNNVPNRASKFSAMETEKIVAFAAEKNSAGRNVYICGSYLNPDAPPMGRCSDDEFIASNSIWCDIDTDIPADTLRQRYSELPPSFIVVTGRTPHRRCHLWWKLDEPVTDPETLRELLVGVITKMGGDPAAKNVTRIMRMGGTIAWPKKSGRQVEATEVIPLNNNAVTIDQFRRVYPAVNYFHGDYSAAEQMAAPVTVTAIGLQPPKITDGREKYMSDMLCASIINLTREKGSWATGDEVLADCWDTYNRKVGTRDGRPLDMDGRGKNAMLSKIKSKLDAFQRGRVRGFPSLETVLSSKSKGNNAPALTKQAFDPETGEVIETSSQQELPTFRATSIDSIDLDKIRPREFLYGDMLGRKYVTMLVAPPGAGKSILTLQVAMSAAAGKPWGCWRPQSALNVWVYNNEEGEDELYRRLKAIIIESKIDKSDISGRFYIDSGERRAITVARAGETDDVVHTPDYDALKAEVLERKIDILVIDPFAETHSVNENSNDQIKQVTRLYRQIAMECNCAVLLVHHTRKGAGRDAESAGNADTARGGGAQIGVVRRAFTLGSMDKDTAEKYGIPMDKKRWFVRFDDAKSNITAPTERTVWLKFKSIPIMNGNILYPDGDYVGVLEHVENIENASKDFADDMAERHEYVVEMMTVCMVNRGETTTTIKDICKYLKENSRLKYSDRRLQDFIKDAIDYYKSKPAYVYNDETHVYRISSERGEKNALSVVRTSRELPV